MSHFACIGMAGEPEAIVGIAQRALREGEVVPAEGGFYMRLAMGAGAEVWIALAQGRDGADGRLVDVNPRLDAGATLRMRLHSAVPDPEEDGLGGLFVGWVNPRDGGTESGDYPLAFDAPDFASYTVSPEVVSVAIVGFVEHMATQPDTGTGVNLDGLPMAARAVIPTGMFFAGDQPTPRAEAVLVGKILETAVRHNDLAGGDFWWARVETLGGQVELVAPPEIVGEPPSVGDLVSARVWVSGRILGAAAGSEAGR